MLGYLSGGRGLQRMKPGLMFLLRLAWESRTRLPLLIMSGFMALGVRIQLEINIDRAVRFMPRLRVEEDDEEDDDDVDDDDDDVDDDDDEEDEDEDDIDSSEIEDNELEDLLLSEGTSTSWSNDFEDYELERFGQAVRDLQLFFDCEEAQQQQQQRDSPTPVSVPDK